MAGVTMLVSMALIKTEIGSDVGLLLIYYTVHSLGDQCVFIGSMILNMEMVPAQFQGIVSGAICCGISIINILSLIAVYGDKQRQFGLNFVICLTVLLIA